MDTNHIVLRYALLPSDLGNILAFRWLRHRAHLLQNYRTQKLNALLGLLATEQNIDTVLSSLLLIPPKPAYPEAVQLSDSMPVITALNAKDLYDKLLAMTAVFS